MPDLLRQRPEGQGGRGDRTGDRTREQGARSGCRAPGSCRFPPRPRRTRWWCPGPPAAEPGPAWPGCGHEGRGRARAVGFEGRGGCGTHDALRIEGEPAGEKGASRARAWLARGHEGSPGAHGAAPSRGSGAAGDPGSAGGGDAQVVAAGDAVRLGLVEEGVQGEEVVRIEGVGGVGAQLVQAGLGVVVQGRSCLGVLETDLEVPLVDREPGVLEPAGPFGGAAGCSWRRAGGPPGRAGRRLRPRAGTGGRSPSRWRAASAVRTATAPRTAEQSALSGPGARRRRPRPAR